MKWWDRAACRGEPLETFYEAAGTNQPYAAPRAICAECPVRTECLDDVMEVERSGLRFGFVGGMSPRERDDEARLRREQGGRVRRRKTFAPCGTNRGFAQHMRFGETACDGCLAAHAAAKLAWRGRDAYVRSDAWQLNNISTIASRRELYEDEAG